MGAELSCHATLTSCIQFSALGEQFVLNIEPYPTISCELVCYNRMELKHKIELPKELENTAKRKNKNNIKSQLSQAPHDRNTMKIRTKNKVKTRQNRRKIMSGKPQGAKLLATIQKARQRQGKKKK